MGGPLLSLPTSLPEERVGLRHHMAVEAAAAWKGIFFFPFSAQALQLATGNKDRGS